jgi:hypothetical protein
MYKIKNNISHIMLGNKEHWILGLFSETTRVEIEEMDENNFKNCVGVWVYKNSILPCFFFTIPKNELNKYIEEVIE